MIGIIDYGLGNVFAFGNVYKRLDIPFKVIKNTNDLDNVSKLILPGVGAFDEAITRLRNSGLLESIENLVFKQNIPVLGICVGMQILANRSEEGKLKGLGWIPGEVKKFNSKDGFPLPHMGWNELIIEKKNNLFKNLDNNSRFYFLHSYCFNPLKPEHVLGMTKYCDEFVSVVNEKNIFGVQFHPEKSHANGITILKNFWKL